MTNNDELALKLKAAAKKATPGPWYVHDKPCEDGNYGIDTSDKEFLAEAVVWWGFSRQSIWREEDAKYIAASNPAAILSLLAERDADKKRIEMLEGANTSQDDHINQQQDRIDALEQRNSELGKYAGKLESISTAAEKLVRGKGRYHSEQNYRALAALFGVTTPDLPSLEKEAQTVSVKPAEQYEDDSALLFAIDLNDESEDYQTAQWLKELRRRRTAMLKAEPVTAAWIAEAKKLAELHGISFVIFRNGGQPVCADPTKFWFGFDPAAPEQEV